MTKTELETIVKKIINYDVSHCFDVAVSLGVTDLRDVLRQAVVESRCRAIKLEALYQEIHDRWEEKIANFADLGHDGMLRVQYTAEMKHLDNAIDAYHTSDLKTAAQELEFARKIAKFWGSDDIEVSMIALLEQEV